MTELLYITHPEQSEFSARVQNRRDSQGKSWLELDRTAFYVEGGGQPSDVGMLSGVKVLRVYEEDDGAVWHELAGVLEDDTVHGVVDLAQRKDYSTQHTAQHVLSQAFFRLFNAQTSSFHLTANSVSIDLSKGDLTWDELLQGEALANTVLRQGLVVSVQNVQNIEDLPPELRKTPVKGSPIRVISVGDFDLCPCGGTHVQNTAEVGILKVVGTERTRGKTRVEFVAGDRALKVFQERIESDIALSTLLSAPYPEQPAAVERILSLEREARREITALNKSLMEYRVRSIQPTARWEHAAFYFVSNWSQDLSEAKLFAGMIVHKEPAIALLVLEGDPARLVLASSVEVDVGGILKHVLPGYEGKGGGNKTSAQGAVPREKLGPLLNALEECLAKWSGT